MTRADDKDPPKEDPRASGSGATTSASTEPDTSASTRSRMRPVLILATGALLALLAGIAFLELADDVRDGDLDRFDDAVLVWIGAHRSPVLTEVILEITALGSGPVLGILAFGICGALLLAGQRRFSLVLVATLVSTPLIIYGLKHIYGRPRPTVVPHLETVTSLAFPSGHTISAVAFFVTIALLVAVHVRRNGLRLFLVAYALIVAALVAGSRVYLGVHFPSDVVGGALIGIAWSLICVTGDGALRERLRGGFRRAHATMPPDPPSTASDAPA